MLYVIEFENGVKFFESTSTAAFDLANSFGGNLKYEVIEYSSMKEYLKTL